MNLTRTPALLLFALLAFTACKKKGGHVPPKTMQGILMDMHLAEAYAVNIKDSLHKPGTKNYDTLATAYKSIFAHYKITQEEFDQSLEWYKSHPANLDTIYSNMINIVTKQQVKGDHKLR